MTLDEAIIHCQEKSCSDTECAKEHKQLGEWLVELKQRREQEEPVSNKIEVSYDAKINEAHRLGREEGILLAKTMFKVPASEDLSEAASVYQTFHRYATPFKAYIDGAQWQKEQMMKNVVYAHVFGKENGLPLYCFKGDDENAICGQSLKVIITKED